MKFKSVNFTISEFYKLFLEGNLNLKPKYQRNDVWSKNDQSDLIDSILSNFPLPNFFIYERSSGKYEIVDGKQRATTIFEFLSGQIQSKDKLSIGEVDEDMFKNYKLSVTEIYDSSDEEIERFYVVVNKKGRFLNVPELYKAEYYKTKFFKLSDKLLGYQNLINLDIFSSSMTERMNDRYFIEELLALLVHDITDKKNIVHKIYEEDIDKTLSQDLEKKFKSIIDTLNTLNENYPIVKTRYKQKNDFYTLFSFYKQQNDYKNNVLVSQYDLLLLLDSDKKYISPSNEDCLSLKDYALNCVSQSNSKNARLERRKFLNSILLNKEKNLNETLLDIQEFFEHIGIETNTIKVEEYYFLSKVAK